MGHTACTEPQCLYWGALYLYIYIYIYIYIYMYICIYIYYCQHVLCWSLQQHPTFQGCFTTVYSQFPSERRGIMRFWEVTSASVGRREVGGGWPVCKVTVCRPWCSQVRTILQTAQQYMAVAVSRSGTTTETSTLWCGAVLLGESFQTSRSIVGTFIFWVKQWKKILFFLTRPRDPKDESTKILRNVHN